MAAATVTLIDTRHMSIHAGDSPLHEVRVLERTLSMNKVFTRTLVGPAKTKVNNNPEYEKDKKKQERADEKKKGQNGEKHKKSGPLDAMFAKPAAPLAVATATLDEVPTDMFDIDDFDVEKGAKEAKERQRTPDLELMDARVGIRHAPPADPIHSRRYFLIKAYMEEHEKDKLTEDEIEDASHLACLHPFSPAQQKMWDVDADGVRIMRNESEFVLASAMKEAVDKIGARLRTVKRLRGEGKRTIFSRVKLVKESTETVLAEVRPYRLEEHQDRMVEKSKRETKERRKREAGQETITSYASNSAGRVTEEAFSAWMYVIAASSINSSYQRYLRLRATHSALPASVLRDVHEVQQGFKEFDAYVGTVMQTIVRALKATKYAPIVRRPDGVVPDAVTLDWVLLADSLFDDGVTSLKPDAMLTDGITGEPLPVNEAFLITLYQIPLPDSLRSLESTGPGEMRTWTVSSETLTVVANFYHIYHYQRICTAKARTWITTQLLYQEKITAPNFLTVDDKVRFLNEAPAAYNVRVECRMLWEEAAVYFKNRFNLTTIEA